MTAFKAHESIFVPRDIYADDFRKSKVPLQARIDKWSDKSAAGGVNVNRAVNVALDQEIVDCLDVFVLSSVCGAKDLETGKSMFWEIKGPTGSFRGLFDVEIMMAVE